MTTNKTIKICIILALLNFSPMANANIFTEIWEALKNLLSFDLTSEVNKSVLPPSPPCEHAIGERSSNFVQDVSSIDNTPLSLKKDAPLSSKDENLMRNFTKLGGDPTALRQSLCFLNKYKNQNFKAAGDPSRSKGIKIANQRYITINDLNYPMSKSRFFLIDTETGNVKAYFSSHGAGGHQGVPESTGYAQGFSNLSGSEATPRGFFVTGTKRIGSSDPRWKFSMRLHGLQGDVNDKSFARAVIMHPFPGIPEDEADSDNSKNNLNTASMFALSKGCTMIPPGKANEIIDKIKAPDNNSGGSLYYNYSPVEKSRGDSYCGEENLLLK